MTDYPITERTIQRVITQWLPTAFRAAFPLIAGVDQPVQCGARPSGWDYVRDRNFWREAALLPLFPLSFCITSAILLRSLPLLREYMDAEEVG